MIVADICAILSPEDQNYFRISREKRFGNRLEDIQSNRENVKGQFYEALTPLRLMLKSQPFIGGKDPLFVDYIIFGSLQWARVASSFKLLNDDDAVLLWFERCLDLYHGLGRNMPAAA